MSKAKKNTPYGSQYDLETLISVLYEAMVKHSGERCEPICLYVDGVILLQPLAVQPVLN